MNRICIPDYRQCFCKGEKEHLVQEKRIPLKKKSRRQISPGLERNFLTENIMRLLYFTTEHQKNMYFVQNYPLIAEKRPCRKRVFFLDTGLSAF
jgi:hypothetical protein